MNMNLENLCEKVIADVTRCYNSEQAKLMQIGIHRKTEGEIRYAAGELVERVLQSIITSINAFLPHNIISKVGSTDFLKKNIIYKGKSYENNSIQVDRHLWYNGKRIAFIENKTYLDTCYYDRALADFKKIAQALEQDNKNPADYAYIVFAGQKAGRDNTFLTYEAEFWYETKNLLKCANGIEPHTFYFLKGTRNSSRPLYKIKHQLDHEAIKEFVKFIISLID